MFPQAIGHWTEMESGMRSRSEAPSEGYTNKKLWVTMLESIHLANESHGPREQPNSVQGEHGSVSCPFTIWPNPPSTQAQNRPPPLSPWTQSVS